MDHDQRYKLHCLMKRRFGEKACEASHKWLRDQVGKNHVADCTDEEVRRAIGALERVGKVSARTWAILEKEKGTYKPRPKVEARPMILVRDLAKELGIPSDVIRKRLEGTGMQEEQTEKGWAMTCKQADRVREFYHKMRQELAPKEPS